MKQKDSFILYRTQWEQLSMLTKEQLGECIAAAFQYANTCQRPEISDPLVKMAFSGIASRMEHDNEKYFETCERNRKNAKKRWGEEDEKSGECLHATAYDRIQSHATAYDSMRTDAKNADKDMDKDKDKDKDKDLDREWKLYAPAREGTTPRGQYGNVFLTDAEYESLKIEFGEKNANKTIERLSEYCKQSGKRYDNHYAVIKAWAREDSAKGAAAGYNSDFDEDEYFEAALARSERLFDKSREAGSDEDDAP